MNVPSKFLKATFDQALENINLAESKSVSTTPVDTLKSFLNKDQLALFFYGDNDTGKTHTACGILNYYSKKVSTLYAKLDNYLTDFAENGYKLPEAYKSSVILCIDELGKVMVNSMTIPAIEQLVKFRNEYELRTIWVTNVALSVLGDSYGNTFKTEIEETRGNALRFSVKRKPQ